MQMLNALCSIFWARLSKLERRGFFPFITVSQEKFHCCFFEMCDVSLPRLPLFLTLMFVENGCKPRLPGSAGHAKTSATSTPSSSKTSMTRSQYDFMLSSAIYPDPARPGRHQGLSEPDQRRRRPRARGGLAVPPGPVGLAADRAGPGIDRRRYD